jgi:protein SCO1/2
LNALARIIVISVAITIAGIGAGLWMRHKVEPPAAPVTLSIKPFVLVDQTGKTVTEADYRGKWLLVFFGFTRCPDICPTSMIFASDLLKNLGPMADKLQIAFVTVDPEFDTVAMIKDYVINFDPRIVGLTGTSEQIAAVTQAFGVYYAKRRLEGQDDYVMDHSNAFYLVDPAGGYRRAFALQRGADEMTEEIRKTLSN